MRKCLHLTAGRVGRLAGVFVLSLAQAALADLDRKIPIQIDNPSGLDRAWPMVCGVPFPQGMLQDAAGLRLENAAGQPVPSQATPAATWLADRSIRWLLLHFNASPAGQYFLTGGQPAGGETSGITAEKTEGRLIIDTGPARFLLLDDEPLISEMRFKAAPGAALVQQGGRGAYTVDQHGRRARLGGPLSEMESLSRCRGHFDGGAAGGLVCRRRRRTRRAASSGCTFSAAPRSSNWCTAWC